MTVTEHVPFAYESRRLSINRIGLWLFFASETMLFAGLLVTRFSLAGTDVPAGVSQSIGLVITTILLLSSYTAFRAEYAAHQGDRAGLTRYLTLTLLLGIAFVAGVTIEWIEAFEAFPPSTEFGTVFFTMTGVHAFHVLTGLLFLAIIFGKARGGAYDDDAWPVEAGVKYWHFVDVVWVFFYPALYLL